MAFAAMAKSGDARPSPAKSVGATTEDERLALTAASLRNILWIGAGWHALYFSVFLPFVFINKRGAAVFGLLGFASTLVVPYLLLRRDRVDWAAWCFVISGTVANPAFVVLSGGIRSPACIFQLALAVTATLLLGRRGALAVTLPLLAFDTCLAFLQAAGVQLPQVFALPPLAVWNNILISFAFTAPPLYLAMERLGRVLAERKRMENELRAVNRQLEEAETIASCGTFQHDLADGKTRLSPELFRITGLPMPVAAEEWMFRDVELQHFRELLPEEEDVAAVVDAWEQLKSGLSVNFVCRLKTMGGELLYISVFANPERDVEGRVTRIIGTVQDVTERETVERKLRDLSAHLEEAREEERKRIAREMHDELGQQLVALKMRAGSLKSLMRSSSSDAIEQMSSLGAELEAAIRTVRRISTELRPGVLDSLGLVAALEWLAEDFEARHGIRCRTNFQEFEVDPQTATVVFRVAQEALTNVVKHAGAREVRISFASHEEAVELQVRDDGKGIRREDMAKPASFGLVGMRERAALVKGALEVSSGEGSGTLLRLTLPAGVRPA